MLQQRFSVSLLRSRQASLENEMNIFQTYYSAPIPSFSRCKVKRHLMQDDDFKLVQEKKERTNTPESNQRRSEWMKNNHVSKYVAAFARLDGDAYAAELAEELGIKQSSVARFLASNEGTFFKRTGVDKNAVVWRLI